MSATQPRACGRAQARRRAGIGRPSEPPHAPRGPEPGDVQEGGDGSGQAEKLSAIILPSRETTSQTWFSNRAIEIRPEHLRRPRFRIDFNPRAGPAGFPDETVAAFLRMPE
jgi:hypothetical protein